MHAHDRQGLARLCRYGARGPAAESRLFRRVDGRYAYETKKGVTLVLTPEQLVLRNLGLWPRAPPPPSALHPCAPAPHPGAQVSSTRQRYQLATLR